MGKSTLFVAAGHGGADAGNTATGIVERDELVGVVAGMRRWARLRQERQGLGGVVFLGDELDLAGQLRALAAWGPRASDGDVCVDLHLDYNAKRPRGGAMVIHNDVGRAREVGAAVLARWCAATGIVPNGVYVGREVAPMRRGWPDYGWTRQAWPAVILELGSLNCGADMEVVRDPQAQALVLTLLVEAWRGDE